MRKNIAGKQFFRLTAQWPAGRKLYGKYSSRIMWLCSCECGKLAVVSICDLSTGNTRSCGCLHAETSPKNATLLHGHSRVGKMTSEYRAYVAAKSRCTNSNMVCWKDYGGRGIKFLFTSFEAFYAALGPKPSSKHSLDRFPDNNGNYRPGNVRWATQKEQCNNRRPHKPASPNSPRRVAASLRKPACHPDRKYCSKNLCSSCYQRSRKTCLSHK